MEGTRKAAERIEWWDKGVLETIPHVFLPHRYIGHIVLRAVLCDLCTYVVLKN